MTDSQFFGRHGPFLSLILVTAVLYVSILLTSQSHSDGDEAVVGVMVRHIVEQGARPLFFYGQPYGGGGAVEAYLAAVTYALVGPGGIPFKAVAMLLSLLTLLLVYRFCLLNAGRSTALITCLLLATATPPIEWHFKMRGGYAMLMLLTIAIVSVFAEITSHERREPVRFILLGLLCGFAYYNLELIIPLLVTLFLASLAWRPVFWRAKPAALTLLGFVIGCYPLVHFNLVNDFENLRYVFGQGGGNSLGRAMANIWPLFTQNLPGFFTARNVDQIVTDLPALAYIEYLAWFGLFAAGAVTHRDWFRSTFRAMSTGDCSTGWAPGIILLFVPVKLTFDLLSRSTGISARYFVPLFPLLAILVGCVLSDWIRRRDMQLRIPALALLVSLGVFNHFRYIGPGIINDDVMVSPIRLANVSVRADSIPAIIDYMLRQNLVYFRAPYFVQWRIIFESDEQLIGSSVGLLPGAIRYPLYDALVADADRIAVIYHRDDLQRRTRIYLVDPDNVISDVEIGEYHVYIVQQPDETNHSGDEGYR